MLCSICSRALPVSVLLGLAATAHAGGPPSLPAAFPTIIVDSGVDREAFSDSFGTESGSWSFPPRIDSSAISVSGSGTITGGADPTVSASISDVVVSDSQNPTIVSAGTGRFLTYSFDIAGPSPVAVPVTIESIFVGLQSPSPLAYGEATFTLEISKGSDQVGLWGNPGTGDLADSIDVDQTIDLTANTVYSVNLVAEVFVLSAAFGSYSASASVDPMFTIDPSFALANPGYSIEYSANLFPDTASTLGLLALGVCAVMMVGLCARHAA